MDLTKALQIPGWMTPEELLWLATSASKSKCIAEIGSWRGRSSRAMADNSDALIFAVDTWADAAVGYPGWWSSSEDSAKTKHTDWLFKEYRGNLIPYVDTRVQQVRMDSQSAARVLGENGVRFDMIFIDADHSYASVCNDIISWKPLLKPGGIFCGHDYNHPQCPDVAVAVSRMIPRYSVRETIWKEEF
jgi:hypothetical protein